MGSSQFLCSMLMLPCYWLFLPTNWGSRTLNYLNKVPENLKLSTKALDLICFCSRPLSSLASVCSSLPFYFPVHFKRKIHIFIKLRSKLAPLELGPTFIYLHPSINQTVIEHLLWTVMRNCICMCVCVCVYYGLSIKYPAMHYENKHLFKKIQDTRNTIHRTMTLRSPSK